MSPASVMIKAFRYPKVKIKGRCCKTFVADLIPLFAGDYVMLSFKRKRIYSTTRNKEQNLGPKDFTCDKI